MRISATAKYIRHSTRKTRLVTQATIVGQPADEAAAHAASSCPSGAARDVAKVLHSAAANAENNHDLSADDLFVVAAHADEGPHAQALPAAGPGPRVPHPQADDAHHRRRREPGGLSDGSQGPSQRLPAGRLAHLERQVVRRSATTRRSSRRTSRSASSSASGWPTRASARSRSSAASTTSRSPSTRPSRASSSARAAPTSRRCASRSAGSAAARSSWRSRRSASRSWTRCSWRPTSPSS